MWSCTCNYKCAGTNPDCSCNPQWPCAGVIEDAVWRAIGNYICLYLAAMKHSCNLCHHVRWPEDKQGDDSMISCTIKTGHFEAWMFLPPTFPSGVGQVESLKDCNAAQSGTSWGKMQGLVFAFGPQQPGGSIASLPYYIHKWRELWKASGEVYTHFLARCPMKWWNAEKSALCAASACSNWPTVFSTRYSVLEFTGFYTQAFLSVLWPH